MCYDILLGSFGAGVACRTLHYSYGTYQQARLALVWIISEM